MYEKKLAGIRVQSLIETLLIFALVQDIATAQEAAKPDVPVTPAKVAEVLPWLPEGTGSVLATQGPFLVKGPLGDASGAIPEEILKSLRHLPVDPLPQIGVELSPRRRTIDLAVAGMVWSLDSEDLPWSRAIFNILLLGEGIGHPTTAEELRRCIGESTDNPRLDVRVTGVDDTPKGPIFQVEVSTRDTTVRSHGWFDDKTVILATDRGVLEEILDRRTRVKDAAKSSLVDLPEWNGPAPPSPFWALLRYSVPGPSEEYPIGEFHPNNPNNFSYILTYEPARVETIQVHAHYPSDRGQNIASNMRHAWTLRGGGEEIVPDVVREGPHGTSVTIRLGPKVPREISNMLGYQIKANFLWDVPPI